MKNRKYEKYVYAMVGVICIIIVGRCVFHWKERNDVKQQTISEWMDKVDEENKIAAKEKEGAEKKEERKQEEQGEEAQNQKQQTKEKQETVQEDVKIRVLITNAANGSYYHENVVIASSEKIQEKSSQQIFPENQQIDVGLYVTEETPMMFTNTQGIQVLSLEKNDRNPIYEGALDVYKTEKGYVIVNEIDLEQYLKYVVPSEMPSSYPMEALKAQAVCARTYALKQIKESRIDDFSAHVDDTVSYQVYHQIDRQASTDQAVEETKGQILCYQKEPIQAYFFSTSCGYTSTEQVWSGEENTENYLHMISVSKKTTEAIANGIKIEQKNLSNEEYFKAYIRTIEDADYEKAEGWYRWNVTFPLAVLNERIEENGWQIGSLEDMEVMKRTNGGAVYSMCLVGTEGKKELINEYVIREFFSPVNQIINRNDGKQIEGGTLLPSAYIDWEFIQENDNSYVKIYGGGYGHGVGMSQNGAKEMAKDGLLWEDIVTIFFENIEICSISDIAY